MSGQRLPGGRDHGARRRGDVVVRTRGVWSPAVQDLLAHLDRKDFGAAPRPLGLDHDHELLSYLPGETVGEQRPWPGWVHTDVALAQVARWLRNYHQAVADYRPPAGARWREHRELFGPDVIIAHNDAAPYNAVWHEGGGVPQLVGFVDWDMAGPRHRADDLAWTAFSWVPLHARHVVAAEGFTDFGRRRERLQLFLDHYRRSGDGGAAVEDAAALTQRLRNLLDDHLRMVAGLAAAGDHTYQQMIELGRTDDLRTARDELGRL